MNFGYFWVFWRIFFGCTGIALPPPPPVADPDFHISENDATFINLTDHDRTLYLLSLDSDKTSHILAKYAHLMFQKQKQFLSQKSN